ncbi:hypothetical protein CPLU01_01708 [Colletotrichum plurivorum]|uniref:Polyamine transport protein n=1 Tax=Colletotrichum plurivorum TaxID=2175906 RepID=A0A8H6KYI2_9PEZI|nr:hypothetical protein CPLU01_01708 [Colletotrichum plurivorum]
MFPVAFNPTKPFDSPVHQPSLEAPGDFEDTPPPSHQPSMTEMSLKKPDKDIAGSLASARSGMFRHALLKSPRGQQSAVDKNLPAPPVLSTQTDDEEMPQIRRRRSDESGYESKFKSAIPSRQHSFAQSQASSAKRSGSMTGSSVGFDQKFPRERICVDPLLHPDESHVKAHHRGLLKGADFCDSGVPGQLVPKKTEAEDEEDEEEDPDSEPNVILARVRRAMTGDDLCLSTVEVEVPKHAGHSHAVKVRPALNTPTFQYPDPIQAQQPFWAGSKVRPFDTSKEHQPTDGDVQIPVGVSKGHQAVSKVRPFNDEADNIARDDRDKYFAIGSDVSGGDAPAKNEQLRSPSMPRSRASTISYKRTAQWLRDLLKNPEHQVRLTELPRKPKRSSYISLQDSPEHVPISRKMTRKSTLPPSDIEPGIFQNTFGQLERLLHEALTLASQVADHEEEHTHPKDRHSPQTLSDESTSQRFSDVDLEDRPLAKRTGTVSRVGRPVRHEVEELYRNISLTPEIGELNNFLEKKKSKSTLRTKSRNNRKTRRSRQAGPVPERISSRKKSTRPKKARLSKSKPLLPKSDLSSMDGSDDTSFVEFPSQNRTRHASGGPAHPRPSAKRVPFVSRNTGEANLPERDIAGRPIHNTHGISLRGKSHVSLRGAQAFSLVKSKRRQPIARDWSPIRKRAIATVACISTALVGLILGIYAGLVPSLQYYIWDTGHTIINGNVGCFLGMAIPTFFCPSCERTEIPQPHRIENDLFGASLMSHNPHQEVVDDYDVRRHGGGMGVWLGIWTWCYIASLGFGFWIGAWVIDQLPPAWGFYISVILVAVVLLLNTLCPEVRRSAFRRSVVEVKTGTDISRRVARGEVMMHRVKDGPRWWGQEMYHGVALSFEMLRQPGFAILAVYFGWIYAQVVLVIILLGALSSKYYRMRSPYVGLMVAALAFGAVAAIPFQKASYFSRARHTHVNTSRMTFDKQVTWTSHLLRRTVFTIGLPLSGFIYTMVSSGPPLHPSGPAILAAAIGFLSCLSISECNGLVMEAFDTSDLQPGMTGRPRGNSDNARKKKNYSAYPRVTAGFAVCHTFGFIFAAGATFLGGTVQRNLGQRAATGVVAGILFILSVLLLLALVRFKEVVIIPESKTDAMDQWTVARKESIKRRESMPKEMIDDKALFAEEEPWRPFIVGNPTSKTRRVNLLELGSMSRFTEIRRRNKLIDAHAHLNRAALDAGLDALDDQISDIVSDIVNDAKDLLGRNSRQSRPSRPRRHHRSGTSDDSEHSSIEMEIIDGRMAAGRRSRRPDESIQETSDESAAEQKADMSTKRYKRGRDNKKGQNKRD